MPEEIPYLPQPKSSDMPMKEEPKQLEPQEFSASETKNIEIKDISEYDDSNPAVEELRAQGITENHLILTTHKLIRDNEPVTPYTLDEVAKTITINALKLLRDKYD